LYGDDVAFADTTEVEYGAGQRNFTSFTHAANEAGISRLYGGIHYRSSIENGLQQGRSIGAFIVQKMQVHTAGAPVAQNTTPSPQAGTHKANR
jgi:hypothetical protein